MLEWQRKNCWLGVLGIVGVVGGGVACAVAAVPLLVRPKRRLNDLATNLRPSIPSRSRPAGRCKRHCTIPPCKGTW